MKTFVTIVVLVVLAGVGACNLIYPSYTHRYRLTLEVEADGEVRTGAGVIEVTWRSQPTFSGNLPPWVGDVRGQAVPVDLGRHDVLLASLGGNGPEETLGIGARFLALRAYAGTVPELPPISVVRPRDRGAGGDYRWRTARLPCCGASWAAGSR